MAMMPSDKVLRFPDNLGAHPEISFEQATSMLLRAPGLASEKAFMWSYIDRPSGQ
jgi:hypothetical protein